MIQDSIYKIDFNRLILWLLPASLRIAPLTTFINAMVTPVMSMYNSFTIFRESMIYRLTITPQVCYLEKLLNDRYDPIARRIYIDKPMQYSEWYLYQEDEQKPEYLFTEPEAQPMFLYTEGETSLLAVDFIVKVPASLTFNEIEFNAILAAYKLPDKEHAIQRF